MGEGIALEILDDVFLEAFGIHLFDAQATFTEEWTVKPDVYRKNLKPIFLVALLTVAVKILPALDFHLGLGSDCILCE